MRCTRLHMGSCSCVQAYCQVGACHERRRASGLKTMRHADIYRLHIRNQHTPKAGRTRIHYVLMHFLCIKGGTPAGRPHLPILGYQGCSAYVVQMLRHTARMHKAYTRNKDTPTAGHTGLPVHRRRGGGGTCQFSHDQRRVPPDSNRFTESRKTSRGPQGVTPQARSKLEASDQLSPAITVVSRMLHRFSRCWYGMSPHAVTDSFCISACLSIGSSHVNAESPW